ncbi:hypothetical protein [Myxococcus sp. RHSTA-1-4]|uniref:hypothetical protein n=1 Tax=Myxococcus sp. RHSTA-1-4 TaxID=2874601 RepID=UPI001CBB1C34|nr:hypothetical protein [Myxococcus sp. RHSTA-1-4]MBZ4415372.1 hypothetical protein [Myxococcus sp. RHSTA-1-4]
MRWVGVLGALLIACEPAPQWVGEAEEPLAPSTQTGELRKPEPREGPVGPEFRVNTPDLRMLETLSRLAVGHGPAVAFDGELYLVVWVDDRRGVNNIFGARVKRDGTLLDPAGFIIAEYRRDEIEDIFASTPSVAFDGEQFVVAWVGGDEEHRKVFVTRVRRDRTVVDPGGIRLPDTPFDAPGLAADIACDSTDGTCLVIRTIFSEDDEPPPEEASRIGAVLLRDGDVVGTGFRVEGPAGRPLASTVAWSGREFLVVWEDRRASTEEAEDRDIFGARVLPDGTVLDAGGGFPIVTGPALQTNPDVAWTGEDFQVVWEERTASDAESDVRGARVSEDGTVVDAGGFPISTAAGDQLQPRVSAGGGTTLVVWTDLRTGRSRIRGARLEGDDVLDPTGFAVSRSLFTQDFPALAFGTGRFLVTFGAAREGAETRTVLATRVDADGDTLDTPALRVLRGAPAQRTPATAYGGGVYLVAWQDERDDAGSHIRAARVRPDGTVLDPSGIRLPSAPGASAPAVAFNGRDFLVTWLEPTGPDTLEVRAARVSPRGSRLDSTSLFIGTAPATPTTEVDVAGGSGRFLVVWTDSMDVRGARVGADGAVLDPGGFFISPTGDGRDQFDLTVAFMRTHFLVVYRETRFTFPFPIIDQLLAARVTFEGTVLDPEGRFITGTGAGEPDLAPDGTGTEALLVWTSRVGPAAPDILGARLGADGSVLAPGIFTVSEAPMAQRRPTATFDGTRYWVAWEDDRAGEGVFAVTPFFLPDLFGARVSRDGTVLDLEGVPIATLRRTEELGPALVSNGRGDSAVFYWRFVRGRELNNFRIKGRLLN